MKSVYSPSEHVIYNSSLYDDYERAGTWPSDGIEISDEDAIKFNGSNQPAGKMLDYVNNKLCWVDLPPKANAELLKEELQELSVNYQSDIDKLNRAWLAAAVSDGVNETAKKDAVISQINDRKSKYDSDRAAAIEKYSTGA